MEELKAIYKKHKQRILPIVLAFAGIFVLFRIVLPQWADISDTRSLIEKKETTVKAKESTLLLLNALSPENVDRDYDLATKALPIQKDLVLIFNELTTVSEKTNVELGGFSVKVGDVYTTEPGSGRAREREVSGIPFLNIVVNVSGQSENMRLFAEELYRSVPLVEIKGIDIAKSDARYDVNFFYKPIVQRPQNFDTVALEGLSNPERTQLEELSTWNAAL